MPARRWFFAPLIALSLSAGSMVAGCGGDPPPVEVPKPVDSNPPPQEKMDIVGTAMGAGNFKTLSALLGEAGLADVLKGDGPFTVFAPTDDAFAKIPADKLEELKKDKTKLAAVLKYHVVAGKKLGSADLKDAVATEQGKEVKLTSSSVNDAKIVTPDVEAKNGVIHAIDSVLMPPEDKPPPPPEPKDIVAIATKEGKFGKVLELVKKAGLDSDLGNKDKKFTFFAPSDKAFEKMNEKAFNKLKDDKKLADKLKMHVAEGVHKADGVDPKKGAKVKSLAGKDLTLKLDKDKNVTVNGKKVVATIDTDNGVIHVIEAIL